jgi:hypothetical protein
VALQDKYRFEKFFSGWFQGADIKDIHKGNVQEMLGWAFFSKVRPPPPPTWPTP